MAALPKLYVIADRETLDRRRCSLGEFALELRDAGVRLVQYRDKAGQPQGVLSAAADLSAAFTGIDAKLVMNDRADLALLAGWSAVHVGQGDLPVEAAKKLVTFVGVSTHTEEQVRAADTSTADYIAIGPVFGTVTKSNAEPVVGLAGMRRARALTTKPLVAIGGITLENCAQVIAAGADSVAVISGIFVEGRSVSDVARDFLALLR
jgi:thiamine-phosphate pyrophosphorylase